MFFIDLARLNVLAAVDCVNPTTQKIKPEYFAHSGISEIILRLFHLGEQLRAVRAAGLFQNVSGVELYRVFGNKQLRGNIAV